MTNQYVAESSPHRTQRTQGSCRSRTTRLSNIQTQNFFVFDNCSLNPTEEMLIAQKPQLAGILQIGFDTIQIKLSTSGLS